MAGVIVQNKKCDKVLVVTTLIAVFWAVATNIVLVLATNDYESNLRLKRVEVRELCNSIMWLKFAASKNSDMDTYDEVDVIHRRHCK